MAFGPGGFAAQADEVGRSSSSLLSGATKADRPCTFAALYDRPSFSSGLSSRPPSRSPTTTQSTIKIYNRKQLLKTKLRQHQLPPKQVALRVQHFQIAVHPAAISQLRQAHGLRKCSHQFFFLGPL